MRRAVQFLVCCGMLAAGVPDDAGAVGLGAPGKVAMSGPGQPVRVWDPVLAAKGSDPWKTIAPLSYPPAGTTSPGQQIQAPVSRPQWSQDGTKLVYTVSTVDPGDPDEQGHKYNQTSIWLYDVPTGQTRRLTHPDQSLADHDPDDGKAIWHVVADTAPTFSPDGTTVAFVRDTNAGADDALHKNDGMQLWTVPASGGGEVRRSSLDEDHAVILALQWIPGTQSILAVRGTDTGTQVFRMSSGGSAGSAIPGTADATPMGLDVSPDGRRLLFVTSSQSGLVAHVVPIGGGSDIATHPVHDFPSYSPGGDGILTRDCIDSRCGLVEKYALDDPASRDVSLGETQRMALRFDDRSSALFDVQPQQLPVIFLPGFLGSEIACGDDSLWPGPFYGRPRLADMRLAADGITNAGCGAATPTGDPLRRFAGLDIYASAADFIADEFGSRGAVLGWDWRKRPQESVLRLDGKIDELLARPGLGHDQGVGRVVLMGHSYGGILIRTYLQMMHPEKVAQVLTLGTPYWGSPKAIFPLAFGVETPVEGPGLDAFLDNSDLKLLARNLGGLYQLWPSAHFGPWLSQDSAALAPRDAVSRLGGNTTLYDQAQGYHASIYDGFENNEGRIDVRALVGTGEPSVGGVDLHPRDGSDDRVSIHWVNGDATVPATSAIQGPEGTRRPLGDAIHLQYQCHVEHVDLAGNEQILQAYRDWLDHDAVPRRVQAGPCPFSALKTDFSPGSLGPEPTSTRSAPAAGGTRRSRAAGPALNLTDAETARLAQVLELPDDVAVVTDDDKPVTLRVQLRDATFTTTALSPDGEGTPRTYGPVSGTVEITPSTSPGEAPTVTADGVAVQPAGTGGGPATPDAPPTPPAPAPPGGGDTPPGDLAASPVSSPARATPPALRLLGGAALRGRRLTARIAVPRAGTLRAVVTRRGRTLGSARLRVRRSGAVALRVTLRRRATGTVRLRIVLTPSSGRPLTLAAAVKPGG